MRFLLDQDVYAVTARFLSELGHDVAAAARLGYAQSSDCALLKLANECQRIFITRDRDFGRLVFVRELGAGIIYLRILPSTQAAVHEELRRVLACYAEEALLKAFVVVEPGRHRFRRLAH